MSGLNDNRASGSEVPGTDIHPALLRSSEYDRDHFQRIVLAAAKSDEAVMITDIDGLIVYVNPAFEAMTGYTSEDALGQSAGIVKSSLHAASFYAGLWNALRANKAFHALFVNRRKNGDLFHEEKTIRPFVNAQGVATHYISTGRDVSERVEMLLTLEYQAYYDCLTGLPNRKLFLDRLGQAIVHETRHGGNFTLLCIDLDEFKAVNDTFGHAVGDDLLRTVAVRLKQCVREEDTVARLGGDEFFLILANMVKREDIERLAGKILEAFSSGIYFDNRNIRIRASMGACSYPFDGLNEAVLMNNADMAMYNRKTAGGNGCSFYASDRAENIDYVQQRLPLNGSASAGSRAP